MTIAFFSSKSYDEEYFDRFNSGHELKYYSFPLNADPARLTADVQGVCVFVNDTLDRAAIAALASHGVQFVALRCAGFNNVDLEAATGRSLGWRGVIELGDEVGREALDDVRLHGVEELLDAW